MNDIIRKELSGFYKQGYKTGFMSAVNFMRDHDKELSKKLIEYYNQNPIIEPITESIE